MTFHLRKTIRNPAFTLVELLAAVAIIAVLVVLIFPAVGRIQRRAKETAKLNNLRQMYIASVSYTADHDGWLIPAYNGNNGWKGLLGNYLEAEGLGLKVQFEKVLIDPCFKGYDPAVPEVSGYAMNLLPGIPETTTRNGGGGGGEGWVKAGTITEPTRRIMIGDSDTDKLFNDRQGKVSEILCANRHDNGKKGMFLMYAGNIVKLTLDEAVIAATDPAKLQSN